RLYVAAPFFARGRRGDRGTLRGIPGQLGCKTVKAGPVARERGERIGATALAPTGAGGEEVRQSLRVALDQTRGLADLSIAAGIIPVIGREFHRAGDLAESLLPYSNRLGAGQRQCRTGRGQYNEQA